MIKGMTGFGTAPFQMNKIRGVVEVKSLNHRYLDLTCYLPAGFSPFEDKIRQMVQKRLERGRVTVSIKITDKPTVALELNKEVAGMYLKYAQILKREFKLKEGLELEDLFRLPGVIETKEANVDPLALWPSAERCLAASIKSVVNMRFREGRSLATELINQLKRMLGLTREIQVRAKKILSERKKVLNPDEFSSIQKSTDVYEEISRLNHYIDEFKQQLKIDLAVGKKLDFIAQEMQRETNTIGSKLQDKIVSNAVIALKSKIEKIRELSQNIE